MSKFPKDFLWGASTAAYQVEGGLHNQWTEWENANAAKLAVETPKRFAWLPNAERLKGKWDDPQNYMSGSGVEHYERYEADFDILQKLNMNAFRFGIEWARLEPEEGKWDEAAVEHYRAYIASLKKRGIEPVLTLWHWTMPTWFTDKGAFEKRSNLRYFERYTEKVMQKFGSELNYVLTLNEPNVYASFSYATGEWPPQRKNPLLMLHVYANLARAHKRAYAVLKAANPNLQVGIAAQLGDVRPIKPTSVVSKLMVKALQYAWNWWFLNRIRKQQDFIGVNYYFTDYRDWLGRVRNPKEPLSDLGWYMEPKGIYSVLSGAWRRYHKPLLITENGLADATDSQRQWWLVETMQAMEKALTEGVELRGYLHWSLLDNFEWAYGWWPKFGLVAVDRKTMQRTIRPSAEWFAKQIQRRRNV